MGVSLLYNISKEIIFTRKKKNRKKNVCNKGSYGVLLLVAGCLNVIARD